MSVKEKIKKRKSLHKNRNKFLEESSELDPRRQAFIAAYMNPVSDTFGKITESGLRAGFTPMYSKNIIANKPDWLCNVVDKVGIIRTVKRNIKKHLELKTKVPVMTAFGPYIDKKTKKMVMHEDPKLLKIQGDMTMFVAEKVVPEYKKKDENPLNPLILEVKQIIIVSPHANTEPTIDNKTN